MTDPLIWPTCALKPLQIQPNPVPFTRSGGRNLGGVQRSTCTDRGHWSIVYRGVPLGDAARPRCWSATIRTGAGGMAGRPAVPVWSFDSSPWADGVGCGSRTLTTHAYDTPFSDGTKYSQPTILVQLAAAAAISMRNVAWCAGAPTCRSISLSASSTKAPGCTFPGARPLRTRY